ncbi:MAG: isoprenylcysteine carboxylmethyltransferase family protein [Candidatus Aureabacteria bacterium]|nr:isoprenylcysteine carboxylmethyltransferase family protein [Candidatus Auribacterota bacterium]
MKNMLPPDYFLICLLLSIGLHFACPLYKIEGYGVSFAGIILITAGIWLNLRADYLLKKYKTTVKPFEKSACLVQEWPYSISRHPMYLGMILIIAGSAFFSGSLSSFTGTFCFFILMQGLFIPHEERMLEQTFGRDFIDYKNRVRCWI